MTDNAKELLEDLRTLTNKVLLELVAENEDLEEQLKNEEIDFIQPKKTVGKLISADVLDKIRTEILDCLKALDEIEKSGFNIYLPNEMSGRRFTYQQCLELIDKYKAESEE